MTTVNTNTKFLVPALLHISKIVPLLILSGGAMISLLTEEETEAQESKCPAQGDMASQWQIWDLMGVDSPECPHSKHLCPAASQVLLVYPTGYSQSQGKGNSATHQALGNLGLLSKQALQKLGNPSPYRAWN